VKRILIVYFLFCYGDVLAQWSRLGNDTIQGSPLYAITYKDKLYLSGGFGTGGGINTTSGIIRWDGTSWEDVPGIIFNQATGHTYFVLNGYLYVHADIYSINGLLTTSKLARYDGDKWAQVPLHAFSNFQHTFIKNGSYYLATLYQNYAFTRVDSAYSINGLSYVKSTIYKFDGLTEPSVFDTVHFKTYDGTQYLSYFIAMESVGNDLYATIRNCPSDSMNTCANYGFYSYDPNTFKRKKIDNSRPLIMRGFQGELYSIGYYVRGLDLPTSKIAKYNKNLDLWLPVGSQDDNIQWFSNDMIVNDMIVFDNAIWLYGGFAYVGDLLVNSIIAWDGNKWTTADLGLVTQTGFPGLIHCAAVYGGELVVGGNFDKAFSYVDPISRVAKWREIRLGIQERKESDLILFYQSPAVNELVITRSMKPIKSIQIYNSQGTSVFSHSYPNASSIRETLSLGSGLYVFKVYFDDDAFCQEKLILLN
jgi:hypothetical protein